MFGQPSRGLTIRSRSSAKFPMARAAMPMFSPSCGSTRMTTGPVRSGLALVLSVPDISVSSSNLPLPVLTGRGLGWRGKSQIAFVGNSPSPARLRYASPGDLSPLAGRGEPNWLVMTDTLIIQDNFAHAPAARGPHAARVFKNKSLGNRGHRECRALIAPSRAKVESTRVSHHRHAETSGIPCAMVLTAYFVISLAIGLSCHHPRAMRSIVAS